MMSSVPATSPPVRTKIAAFQVFEATLEDR